MNPEAEAHLKEVLAKAVDALTPEDKEFIKARWHYVGKNSRAKFQSILDEKPQDKPKPVKPKDALVHPEETPNTTEEDEEIEE